MSSVDLNIIERGLKGQEWTAETAAGIRTHCHNGY